MAQGTIIRIDRDRGTGVIRPDDGTDQLVFHHSALPGRLFDRVQAGQRVAFNRRREPHAPMRLSARNIRLLPE
jgi:cold shock CspA family protein